MGFYDAFFGSDQSLYTAYAIIAAIISICVTILFTSTDIPIGSRLLMILFVVITLVPSIFLTLFEITCIVTGGTEPNNWWCYTFAWILAAFIIIYCIFVIIISIVSLVTYNKAIDNVNNDNEKNKVNPQEANNIAKQIMVTQKPIERFYDASSTNNTFDMNNISDNIQEIIKSIPSNYQMPFSSSVADSLKSLTDTEKPTDKPTDKPSEKFTDGMTLMGDDYNFLDKNMRGGIVGKISDELRNSINPSNNDTNNTNNNNNNYDNFADYNGILPGSADDNYGSYPNIFNNNN